MAGDSQCLYAPWFKAHHKYEKIPSDFDVAKWSAEHSAMTDARVQDLRGAGWTVYVEGQNQINLAGKTGATLSGKPDIVAVRDDVLVVVDCKTGTPKNSDYYQVLLYMYCLRKFNTHPSINTQGMSVRGEVAYKTQTVEVPSHAVDDEFEQTFRTVMTQVVAADEPRPSPSFQECRYCDISAAYCQNRVDTPPQQVKVDIF